MLTYNRDSSTRSLLLGDEVTCKRLWRDLCRCCPSGGVSSTFSSNPRSVCTVRVVAPLVNSVVCEAHSSASSAGLRAPRTTFPLDLQVPFHRRVPATGASYFRVPTSWRCFLVLPHGPGGRGGVLSFGCCWCCRWRCHPLAIQQTFDEYLPSTS